MRRPLFRVRGAGETEPGMPVFRRAGYMHLPLVQSLFIVWNR